MQWLNFYQKFKEPILKKFEWIHAIMKIDFNILPLIKKKWFIIPLIKSYKFIHIFELVYPIFQLIKKTS